MSYTIELGAVFGTIVFLRPWALFVLPPALWLLWRLWRFAGQDGGPWSPLVDPQLRAHVIDFSPARRGHLGLALAASALVLGVLALAGIARPVATEIAWRADAARVLVVDLSPAMAAGEPGAAPIERARLKLLDLLTTVSSGQTALVVYGEEPYLVAPLTTDVATIALLVPELAPEAVPLAGDQPERALRMAAAVLERSGAAVRDLVWITAAPNPAAALDAFAAPGVRISVLHLAPAPDPRVQAAIAASGGVYRRAQAERDDVLALAAMLAAGQTYIANVPAAAPATRELGPWLLVLLLPIAACAFRRGVILSLVLMVLIAMPTTDAVASAPIWANADQRGLDLLEAGEAEAAARTFTDPRWRAVALYRAGRHAEAAAVLEPLDDAGSHYNRGNALARLGRLEQARDAYTAALHLRPDNADIAHNLALVRKLLEPENPPQDGEGAPDAEADEQAGPPPATEADPDSEASAGADRSARSDAPRSDQGADALASTISDGEPEPTLEPSADGATSNTLAPQVSPPGAAGEGESSPAAPGLAGRDPQDRAPSPSARALPRGRADPEREAAQLAEQWLRRVPDRSAGLLQRKLMLEHERRISGTAERPWQ